MLPFVEYSLHGRLLNKLKLKGMNALFGLNIQITVGDTMIVGVAVSVMLVIYIIEICNMFLHVF